MMDSQGKEEAEGLSSAATPWRHRTADQTAFPRFCMQTLYPHMPASHGRKAEKTTHEEQTRNEGWKAMERQRQGKRRATETRTPLEAKRGQREQQDVGRDNSQPAERKFRVPQRNTETAVEQGALPLASTLWVNNTLACET